MRRYALYRVPILVIECFSFYILSCLESEEFSRLTVSVLRLVVSVWSSPGFVPPADRMYFSRKLQASPQWWRNLIPSVERGACSSSITEVLCRDLDSFSWHVSWSAEVAKSIVSITRYVSMYNTDQIIQSQWREGRRMEQLSPWRVWCDKRNIQCLLCLRRNI